MSAPARAARWLTVALLAPATGVVLVPQAQAAGTVAVAGPPHLIRTNRQGLLTRLGPWNVAKDPSLGRADLLFGAPVAKTRLDQRESTDCGRITEYEDGASVVVCSCEVRWESRRVGRVRARFLYESKRRYQRCSGTGVLDWFITGDASWATEKGLRVGQQTDTIRSLYPCAEFRGLSDLWHLTARPWYLWDSAQRTYRPDPFQWTWTTYAEPHAGQVKSLRAAIDSAGDIPLGGYAKCIRAND